MTELLSEDELAGLKALRELAETLPPYDWQWTTLTGENGPYQSHEDMIEGIAKTIRHSESLGLHAITWNDEDVDGRSSVVCTTGNGPTSPLHAQYIAAVKPSNILRLLSHMDGLRESRAVDLELLAQFMIQHSIATGHGESIGALLAEFDWQIRELRATARTSALKEAAEVAKSVPQTCTAYVTDSVMRSYEIKYAPASDYEAAILAIAEVK